jgi:hypothetical protein
MGTTNPYSDWATHVARFNSRLGIRQHHHTSIWDIQTHPSALVLDLAKLLCERHLSNQEETFSG